MHLTHSMLRARAQCNQCARPLRPNAHNVCSQRPPRAQHACIQCTRCSQCAQCAQRAQPNTSKHPTHPVRSMHASNAHRGLDAYSPRTQCRQCMGSARTVHPKHATNACVHPVRQQRTAHLHASACNNARAMPTPCSPNGSTCSCLMLHRACDACNCLSALISCAQACHVQARSRPCAHTRARLYIQCLHSPHLLRARTRVLPLPLCERAARHREPISANNLPPRRSRQVRATVCNDARNVLRSCPQNGDMCWWRI